MAFRFRLEKVARYRQKLVDEQGRAVARAGRVVAHLEARIGSIDDDIARQQALDPIGAGAAVSVRGMMARTHWIEHLSAVREDLVREREMARLVLEAEREKLKAAWRDVEVLNRLREKQKSDWAAEQARRESRELDEVGQVRAERQRRSKVASRPAQSAREERHGT